MSARRAQQDTYRRGQGDLSPFLCEGVYYRTWVVAMAFTVSDFMTRQVVTVTPQDRLRQAAERMQARGCRRLPVVEGERLVGIVTEMDMLNALIQVLIAEPDAPPTERRT